MKGWRLEVEGGGAHHDTIRVLAQAADVRSVSLLLVSDEAPDGHASPAHALHEAITRLVAPSSLPFTDRYRPRIAHAVSVPERLGLELGAPSCVVVIISVSILLVLLCACGLQL